MHAESREWVNVSDIHERVRDSTKQRSDGAECDSVPSFEKYIPIPYESLVSNRAPLIVHDQVDRSEWIRAQLAVDSVPVCPGSAVHRVRSDPSLVSGGSVQSEDDDYDIDWTDVSPELEALCRNSKSTRRPQARRTY